LNGHGGGIYAYESSSYIFKCNISGNESSERGAGIFVGRYGWPVIRENIISLNNTVGARADGGGIGSMIAMPETISFDNALLDKARNKRIRIIENDITRNTAKDDGGGVYLSVMSKALFKRNEIAFNTCWKSGGGVRASLGSDIQMTGDSIHENQANFHYITDPEEMQNGGGGVASRNADLILTDVTITNNVNHAFAGGGIFLGSSSEGDTDNSEEFGFDYSMLGLSSYDDVLRDHYLKAEVQIELKGNTAISGNVTSRFQGQAEDSRKGGGLYLLRFEDNEFTALPLKVSIENFFNITNNYNNKITEVTGDVPQIVIDDPSGAGSPDSNNFHLLDMVGLNLPPEQHEPEDWIIDALTVTAYLDDQNSFVWPPVS
jgi:hypothetical protein